MQSLLTDSFSRPPAKVKQSHQEQSQQEAESSNNPEQQEQQQSQNEPKRKASFEELEAMKDGFESDESYLIVTEEVRDQKMMSDAVGNTEDPTKRNGKDGSNNAVVALMNKFKKINKKKKDYNWKLMWVQQENAIKTSKPLWIKKWIRVKINSIPEPVSEVQNEN